jgi:copper chaperone CopZ
MKIFTILPALMFAFVLNTSAANACDEACKTACKEAGKTCDDKTCDTKHCSDEKHKCDGKSCSKHDHKTSSAADPAAEVTTKTTAAATGGTGYQLNVKGMHCASCIDKVKEALSTLPGLEKDSVRVDLEGKKAFVVIQKGATTDEKALKNAVTASLKDSGYSVTSVKTVK